VSPKLQTSPAVIGIDIGKNLFHIVGQKSARCHRAAAEMVAWLGGGRLAYLPPCPIGMEACVGAHHLSRALRALVMMRG
jgi:transposase